MKKFNHTINATWSRYTGDENLVLSTAQMATLLDKWDNLMLVQKIRQRTQNISICTELQMKSQVQIRNELYSSVHVVQ